MKWITGRFETPLVVILLFNLNSIRTEGEMDETIETKYGKMKGTIEEGYNGRKALVFRGIPFAQPPVGDLRFRDPKPIEKFTSDPFDVSLALDVK